MGLFDINFNPTSGFQVNLDGFSARIESRPEVTVPADEVRQVAEAWDKILEAMGILVDHPDSVVHDRAHKQDANNFQARFNGWEFIMSRSGNTVVAQAHPLVELSIEDFRWLVNLVRKWV